MFNNYVNNRIFLFPYSQGYFNKELCQLAVELEK